MELLLSLKFRGCGKAGAMEIPSGFPQLLGKGFAFSTFPHPIFFIKIGHFYFAQNRTFLFWVDRAGGKVFCAWIYFIYYLTVSSVLIKINK
jgi:hypothetical protein